MKVVTTNLLNRFWQNGVKPIKDALTNKVDSSKVVNSLLTTGAGFVLDARQGKALDDKIAKLNSDFNTLSTRVGDSFKVYNVGDWQGNLPSGVKYGGILRLAGASDGKTYVNDSYFLLVAHASGTGSTTALLYAGEQVNGINSVTWTKY